MVKALQHPNQQTPLEMFNFSVYPAILSGKMTSSERGIQLGITPSSGISSNWTEAGLDGKLVPIPDNTRRVEKVFGDW
ncbi:hypothetical protein JTB14_038153 [Gonioctena quinquepunctata]|nr:hypothetical protein JTB14_038153 [Gonioctena quinquepunctata]